MTGFVAPWRIWDVLALPQIKFSDKEELDGNSIHQLRMLELYSGSLKVLPWPTLGRYDRIWCTVENLRCLRSSINEIFLIKQSGTARTFLKKKYKPR